mmetsp:Transcript_7675/g.16149  ORF Transcript_7675/g.16149 Transcript_7675/m.16149 type:complete len:500 (+) Transcript_7675:268-1767(+)
MSVLGTLSSEKIVIVPPEPEAYLSEHRQKLTYWHLYHHDLLTSKKHKNGFHAGDGFLVEAPKTMGVSSDVTQPALGIHQDGGVTSKSEEKKTDDPANAVANNYGNDNSALITRDPRKGAFTFSVNSEYDLLLHIQRALDQSYRSSGSAATMSNIDTAKVIMKSIDDYCFRKQWMFHVGNEKSAVIANFLEGGIDAFVERNQTKKGVQKNKYVCVELGTYCGYSALVLASTLQKALLKYGEDAFDFHIYTTEISSKFLNVATNIIRLSKMEKYVTTILIEDDASLSETLKRHLPEDSDGIDFLLLDHAKNLYLPNLLELESAELIRQHSRVCADNVVFNRLDDYRNHMKKWEKEKVVETSLEEMNLEYSNNLKDGMEMTIYLRDLPNDDEVGWWSRVWKKPEQSAEKNNGDKQSKSPLKIFPGIRELVWWRRVIRRNLEQTEIVDQNNGQARSETAVSLPGANHKGFWKRLLFGKLDQGTKMKNDPNGKQKRFWKKFWRK